MTKVKLDVSIRPEGSIYLVTQMLGVRPYVNTSVDIDGEGDDETITFSIEAGGGVVESDVEELALYFEGLAEYLRAVPADAIKFVGVEDDEDEPEDEDEDVE